MILPLGRATGKSRRRVLRCQGDMLMSMRRILFEVAATAWDILQHGDIGGHVQALLAVLTGAVCSETRASFILGGES